MAISIQILQSNNVYSMYVSSFTYKATVMCAVVLLVLQYVHICLGMSVGTHKTYAVVCINLTKVILGYFCSLKVLSIVPQSDSY